MTDRTDDLGFLHGQYLVFPEAERPIPVGWESHTEHGWTVAAHPDLPITVLGNKIIVGHAFEDDGIVHSSSDYADRMRWAGRWLELDFTKEQAELGPSGMLPLCYCHETRSCSSNPYLLSQVFDRHLYDRFRFPDTTLYYPFGLTPFVGVERLIPNHRLDLKSFEWTRIRQHPGYGISPFEQVVTDFADHIRKNILAFRSYAPLSISLTAGKDSRLLMACSREVEGLEMFTITGRDINPVDGVIAPMLAKAAKVPYDVLSAKRLEHNREEFFKDSGYCISGTFAYNAYVLRDYKPDHILVNGIGGELLRPFFSRASDDPSRLIGAEEIVSRMTFPFESVLIERCERYLDQLEAKDLDTVLAMVYSEQRLGSWGACQTFVRHKMPTLAPMISHENYERMLQLTWEERLNCDLHFAIIQKYWPELLEIPINRYPGIRGVLNDAKTLADRVFRKGKKVLKLG